MNLSEEQARMRARHNPALLLKPTKLPLRKRTAKTAPRNGRRRPDLSKLRFQVEVEDRSSYIVRDTLTGLCFTVCATETGARKRALELNKFTGNCREEITENAPSSEPYGPPLPTMRELRQAARDAELERKRKLLFIRRKVKHFWANVDMTLGNCWLWTGPRAAHGYGQYSVAGVHIMAHRYAYIVSRGPVSDGYQITHTCGNRLCMNPDHLLAVTPQERADMQKARQQRAPLVPQFALWVLWNIP